MEGEDAVRLVMGVLFTAGGLWCLLARAFPSLRWRRLWGQDPRMRRRAPVYGVWFLCWGLSALVTFSGRPGLGAVLWLGGLAIGVVGLYRTRRPHDGFPDD